MSILRSALLGALLLFSVPAFAQKENGHFLNAYCRDFGELAVLLDELTIDELKREQPRLSAGTQSCVAGNHFFWSGRFVGWYETSQFWFRIVRIWVDQGRGMGFSAWRAEGIHSKTQYDLPLLCRRREEETIGGRLVTLFVAPPLVKENGVTRVPCYNLVERLGSSPF
jgi:hypothetical protein